MTKATIQPVENPADLFRQYAGEFNPQPVELWLDTRTGNLGCDYKAGTDNAVTFDHHNRLILSTRIPCLTADAANQLMQEIVELAQRVLDGADTDWDGNNTVGVFTADAEAAWEEITEICARTDNEDLRNQVTRCTADDWFIDGDDDTVAELGITADTTDERLGELADEQVQLIRSGGGEAGYTVVDRDDILGHITRLRDEVRENADEDEPGTGNEEWDTLLRALRLMAKHPMPDSGPFFCSHDRLLVCVDESKFTAEEIAQLEEMDFVVDNEGGFSSSRFANP